MALDVSVNGDRKKLSDKVGETLRFDLELDSPTDDTFSEFSYLQLVRTRKKKVRHSSTPLLGDPGSSSLPVIDPIGEDSSDKLTALARRFEEKYAPKKRKRVIHDSDYIDRGYGYDLADSFVDDSELYEDFVPDHLDTKFGGFYINTGELEFRTAEDIDDVDFAVKKARKPKIKKQPSHHTPQAILASQKLKKAKQHAALQKAPQSSKKTLFPTGLASLVKQSSLNVKPPSPKRRRKKVKLKIVSAPPPAEPTFSAQSFPVPSPVVPISIGDRSVAVPIFNSSPGSGGSKDGLGIPGVSVATNQGGQSVIQSTTGILTNDQTTSSSPATKQTVDVPKPPPVLPGNLPPTVMEQITKLIERIKLDKGLDGKIKRDGYTEALVEIELVCRVITMKNRNAVFEYLAYNLGVARGTLTKRMKPVFKKREDDALVEPLQKLKLAVEASMPKQIALYEEEIMKARLESTSSIVDKSFEMEEETRGDEVFDDLSLAPGTQLSGGQPVEGQSSGGQPSGGQGEGTTNKPKRLPRKRYRWNDNEEVKKLLCDVVRVKVISEDSCSRISKEKGEEVINQFLEDKVKPIWPKGWMQKSVLYKISESVHKSYTSPPQRKGLALRKEKQVAVKKEPCEHKIVSKEIPGPPKKPVPLNLQSFPVITVPKISNPSSIPQTTEAKLSESSGKAIPSGSLKSSTNSMKRPAADKPSTLAKPSSIVQTLLGTRLVLSQLSQLSKANTTSVSSSGQYLATSTHKPTSLPKQSPNTVTLSSSLPSAAKIDSLLQSALAQQTKVTVGALTNIISSQQALGGSSVMSTSAAPSTSVPASTRNEKSPYLLTNLTPQIHLPRPLLVAGHASLIPAPFATTISNRLSALISNPVTTTAPITGVQKKPINLDSLVGKLHGNNKAPIKKTAVIQTNQAPDSFCKQPQLTLSLGKLNTPGTLPLSTVRMTTPEGSGKGSNSTAPKQHVLTAHKSVEGIGSTVVREDTACVSSPSLNSPMKSPVEQIMEEHSYLGSQFLPVPPDIQSQQCVLSTTTQQQVYHKDE